MAGQSGTRTHRLASASVPEDGPAGFWQCGGRVQQEVQQPTNPHGTPQSPTSPRPRTQPHGAPCRSLGIEGVVGSNRLAFVNTARAELDLPDVASLGYLDDVATTSRGEELRTIDRMLWEAYHDGDRVASEGADETGHVGQDRGGLPGQNGR
jgi:hypothetical protein